MAAVFSRLPMRVRCATQRDHVFHPEMNYSQTQLASLIGSPSGGWPTISRRARTSKKDKELVTLEYRRKAVEFAELAQRATLAADKAHMLRSAEAWLDRAKQSDRRIRNLGERPLTRVNLVSGLLWQAPPEQP